MYNITLERCPETILLVNEGDTAADVLKLQAENILIRWINYIFKHNLEGGYVYDVRSFGDIHKVRSFVAILNDCRWSDVIEL
jgi:hypothetical protein